MTGLVGELRKQVSELEKDLRARVDGPDEFALQEGVGERWRAEHQAALKAGRTAASWQAWRDELVTQVAVAWVLVTVFARFCEDNGLVSKVWIAGPTRARRQEALDARRAYFQANPEHNDRDWLKQIIAHFASMKATAGLVDDYPPLHQVAPSGDASRRLLEFWWEQDSEGELLWRFVNPELDTRFLGDLYQHLSEEEQEKYALLQTPEFVEEFILNQTFEPALNERPLEGFAIIDPTCGSGHFLLDAFQRLFNRWSKRAPNLGSRTLAQNALDGVHGVDINPFAVKIARFRLIVSALKAAGENSLERVPDFQVKIAAGDSLYWGAWQRTTDELPFGDDEPDGLLPHSTENIPLLLRIMDARYDVVVGNPPYITAKDKAQNAMYRRLYHYCKGAYALTVPFMELFFDLGRRGERPGWIGQITSNSFMKREFGAPLIEKFLTGKDLRLVVDTSGVYIPGHGTPTVILIGRNCNKVDSSVRAVLGVRGEPGMLKNAAEGIVWRSIVEHLDEPGFDNGWITVAELDDKLLARHPWSLSGGGAVELVGAIDRATDRTLKSVIFGKIGFASFTGADEAFFASLKSLRRDGVPFSLVRPIVLGEYVRDWESNINGWAFVPYGSDGSLAPLDSQASWFKRQWLQRSITGSGGGDRMGMEKPWWGWYRWVADRYRTPLTISFAEVATHNHFVLDRGGKVFNRTAPVVKLPEGSTEGEHQELLGVLNSSVSCFWLKQNCYPKAGAGTGRGMQDEAWEERYQFNGANVQDLPLPVKLPSERARRIDAQAQELAKRTPQAIVEADVPTRQVLDVAHVEHEQIRAQMIVQQEELDWEVYRLYSLIDEDLTYQGEAPGLNLGERAFEIMLAREGNDTAWFERHRSTPITEIPGRWPAAYRELVQRRLDLIESDKNIRLLEKPEYKRRWAIEPWDKRVQTALKDWLLDKLEDRALWFDRQGRPRPHTVAQLADEVGRDGEFTGVLELWAGRQDIPVVTSLQKLLDDPVVPFLAAHRYKESGLDKRKAWEHTWDLQRKEDAGEKLGTPIPLPPKYKPPDFAKQSYWQHRGKLDVPKERFILYPDAARETDPTPLLGWAGWDHAQQALALATIMNEREQEGWTDERMVPLIAGLAELQPWVKQWHDEIDPTYGVNLADFIGEVLTFRSQRAGKTADELAAWRPERTRGRRKKTTQGATA